MTSPVENITVPPMPPLVAESLRVHESAREALADRLTVVDSMVDGLFRSVQAATLTESLSHVLQVDPRATVFSPRRRFLSPAHVARLAGSAAAFRHVDARLHMLSTGHIAPLVGPETLPVVHALAESHDPDRRETNPGLFRATSVEFEAVETVFVPPPFERCAELVEAILQIVNDAPAPAITRAGWMVPVLLSVHPFVDGNGRATRLLFQMINSSEYGTDWGSIEMWSRRRSGYIQALKDSQVRCRAGYDGRLLDPVPFMHYASACATQGAQVALERLNALDHAWNMPWESSCDEARLIELLVWASTTASLDDLLDIVTDPQCTHLVNALVDAGRLEWGPLALLRLSEHHPLSG